MLNIFFSKTSGEYRVWAMLLQGMWVAPVFREGGGGGSGAGGIEIRPSPSHHGASLTQQFFSSP